MGAFSVCTLCARSGIFRGIYTDIIFISDFKNEIHESGEI